MTTILDANLLDFDYDEHEDILYISVEGRGSQPAMTYETDEGHLVRLDPETFELLGVEVLGYRARWEGQDINLHWHPPTRAWHRGWLSRGDQQTSYVQVPRHARPAVR